MTVPLTRLISLLMLMNLMSSYALSLESRLRISTTGGVFFDEKHVTNGRVYHSQEASGTSTSPDGGVGTAFANASVDYDSGEPGVATFHVGITSNEIGAATAWINYHLYFVPSHNGTFLLNYRHAFTGNCGSCLNNSQVSLGLHNVTSSQFNEYLFNDEGVLFGQVEKGRRYRFAAEVRELEYDGAGIVDLESELVLTWQMPPPQNVYDISFATFIPGDYITPPFFHPAATCGTVPLVDAVIHKGDDREFTPQPSSFRTFQSVAVVPGEDAPNIISESARNATGVTDAFAAVSTLLDGEVNDEDYDGTLHDCFRWHDSAYASTAGMNVETTKLAEDKVAVRFTTDRNGPVNPLLPGPGSNSFSIDWDITVTIDDEGVYDVRGTWDGFPNAELYINGQTVWLSQDVGRGPYSLSDVGKLRPGYGDTYVRARGKIESTLAQNTDLSTIVPEPCSLLCFILLLSLATTARLTTVLADNIHP